MPLLDSLRDVGLKKSEAKVYLYVLENNHASPPQIAKGTGILRTNCYHILQSLKDQGLVREEKGPSGRKVYFANDPESLLRSAQTRAGAVERLIPDIRAVFSAKTNKPSVHFYDGLDEIQDIYHASLRAQEIFALGSTAKIAERMPEFLPWYFAQIKKHNITLHDIISSPSSTKGLAAGKAAMASYMPHVLPEKYGETPTDILVWDDNVALITLDEPYFGTVLHNASLAHTFKIVFRVLADAL